MTLRSQTCMQEAIKHRLQPTVVWSRIFCLPFVVEEYNHHNKQNYNTACCLLRA